MADVAVPRLNVPGLPEKSSDFREYYCNHFRVAITPVDILVIFGHIAEKSADTPVLLEDVAIRFSPQTFKNIAHNFMAAIRAWEGQFGTVQLSNKTPEEVLAAIEAAAAQVTKNP